MACRQIDARLVHFSTDYVFDGTATRPYAEEDPTHPLGAYAVSKLAGEIYAQAYLDKALIVRTSGVFGPGGLATARGNFVEIMLRMAASNQPIRIVEDHFASPTYTPFLAARTADLIERGQSGVFHAGGGTPISWFDFAQIIFDVAGLHPALHLTSVREYRTPARRPKYSALSNAKMERAGVEQVDFDELVRISDYISIHTPLLPATHHLFNAEVLRRMKPSSYLINTARGPIIDEAALASALDQGHLAGAALDVMEQEPPSGSPLFGRDNVIVTPHTSFYSEESLVDLQTKAAEEVVRVLTGQTPRNPVNPEALKTAQAI